MPFQFRIRTLLLATAAICICLFLYDLVIQARGSGSFDLTVKLRDPRLTEIQRLDCVCWHIERDAIAMRDHPNHTDFAPVVLVGSEFVTDVNSWDRSSGLGWRTSYDHFRWLVIWAHYHDGSEHCQLVEIPYGRGNRELAVDFGPEQDTAVDDESPSSEPAHGSKEN